MSINPVDQKFAEASLIGKMLVSTPASPGLDFSGRVVSTGSAVNSLTRGQHVFGRLDFPTQFGTLGRFVKSSISGTVPLPDGVDPDHAAAIGTAGLTAYQCITPNVKPGDKVFINGGSGGTGMWGIQIAKMLNCRVTTSCSTANVELCKSFGADEVIDYRTTVSQKLRVRGQVFSLVVDNVGTSVDLYNAADDFLVATGKFVQAGGALSVASLSTLMSRMLRPSLLGGGRRKFEFVNVKNNAEHFAQLGRWLQEGMIKAFLDSIFKYNDAPQAYEKLGTGHTRVKIVVQVCEKS